MPKSKIFNPHKRKKLVHPGTLLALLFLIEKLQGLASSCLKLMEIFVLLEHYIDWIKCFEKSKLFRPHERQKLVYA